MNFEDVWSGARQFKDFERSSQICPATNRDLNIKWMDPNFVQKHVVLLLILSRSVTSSSKSVYWKAYCHYASYSPRSMQALGSSGRKKDSLSRARSLLSSLLPSACYAGYASYSLNCIWKTQFPLRKIIYQIEEMLNMVDLYTFSI